MGSPVHSDGWRADFEAIVSGLDHPMFVVTAREARALDVHLLAADQLALAELFGGRTGDETDKFAHCRWPEGPEGLPILEACRSWFAGMIRERLNLGDHVGFLLEPVAARHEGSGPHLGYQAVRHLPAGHAP